MVEGLFWFWWWFLVRNTRRVFFFSLEGQTEGQNGGGQRAVSVMVLFTSGSIRSLYRVLYSVRKSRVVVVVHL